MSVHHPRWVISPTPSSELIAELSKAVKINSTLATLLVNRGIDSFDQAKEFFRPDLTRLHDPFLMADMDKAVARLDSALERKEKILIYGDYDVDGTTSVALVYSFLRQFTENVAYYVPDRYTEGYGISAQGMEWAAANGYSLVIALDCGIKGHRNIALAAQLGVDVIVCDHHLPDAQLPDAVAVLDPKRTDCAYPYKELSGCGVGFKLLQGFCIRKGLEIASLFQYLDLVTVSIASDIVPITGENRILAYYGLRKLNENPLPCLKILAQIAAIKSPIRISDVVFYLGPRINAAGRLTHAKESVKLLISSDTDELERFAKVLHQTNQDRREFDQSITEEALEMIRENYSETNSTVLFKSDWHKGVVGIVASRCIEKYYRPTIILTESNGKATGSARSIAGFDLHEAVSECADLLDQFGGHMHAAGLSLSLDKVDAFRQKFEQVVAKRVKPEDLVPKLPIDAWVDFHFITDNVYNIIEQMAPFGPGNMQPIFASENVYLRHVPNVLKDQHLKIRIYQKGIDKTFDAIGFGLGHFADRLSMDKPFSMAFQITENNFNDVRSLQLLIKDIKPNG